MQVSDVKTPLSSVARMCDAGHTNVCRKDRGGIADLSIVQEIKFYRVDSVQPRRESEREVGGGQRGE